MVRLFRWLFFGDAHMHKWVCVNSVNNNVESGIPNEHCVYVLFSMFHRGKAAQLES